MTTPDDTTPRAGGEDRATQEPGTTDAALLETADSLESVETLEAGREAPGPASDDPR